MAVRKKLKLSATAIKTYEQCPRKYYYTYIEKPDVEKTTWPHSDLGLFVHDVLDSFHTILMKEPSFEWPGLMSETCKKTIKKHKLTKDQKGIAKEMLKKYLDKLDKNGMPNVVASEAGFNISVDDDTILRGYIDRIDLDEREDGEQFHIIDYKGLALDTPIPTPSGWTTMQDLQVGDKVLGSNGQPTNVIAKSKIHNRKCYRLRFSDNSSVVCDNVHKWKIGFTKGDSSNVCEEVVDADELYSKFSQLKDGGADGSFVIENSQPLNLPNTSLPIDPWLLGKLNKYVPPEYLRGGFEQRLSLLQGLMDANGYWDSHNKKCVFESAGESLAKAVAELIRTFGITVQTCTARDKSERVVCRVEFEPVNFCPFQMSRKANSFLESQDNSYKSHEAVRRKIVDIEPIDSVPTQCISVDAEDKMYLCGESFIPTHNTGKSKYLDEFQLLIYGLYLLEKKPELEKYKGSYIVLAEDCRFISYDFTKTDLDKVKAKIRTVADEIKNDKTWEPKPQFLCKFCDYRGICPASPHKEAINARRDW